jgi:hypothetical protein
MLPDPIQLDMVSNAILELSSTISNQWLEMVIAQYCHDNQMVQPQKNGLSGLAVLKIIDILMKLRESESIFDLLNQEQIQIQRQLNDLNEQPIYVRPSTRIQHDNLENKFYKELDPFSKEGIMWNVFAWRVKANLHDRHQENDLTTDDSLQMIERRFQKMKQQFTLNCPDETLG